MSNMPIVDFIAKWQPILTTWNSAVEDPQFAEDCWAVGFEMDGGRSITAIDPALFQNFIPGYEQSITGVDATHIDNGHFDVRHEDGSGTRFYDAIQYHAPRGEYQTYEDANGNSWYGIRGEACVERKPVYENGQPVYDGDRLRTVSVPGVRYNNTPTVYSTPEPHDIGEQRAPNRRKI